MKDIKKITNMFDKTSYLIEFWLDEFCVCVTLSTQY